MTTRRERLRAATLEEIKAVAWRQIAEEGVAALSLRAIARDMGMTAPGLYRYYENRDELVTALIIDAFGSFADALEAGRDKWAADDHLGRFRGACRAYFDWAVAYTQRYVLIFGAAAANYRLTEAAFPAARRSFLALQSVLGEAHRAGKLGREAHTTFGAGLGQRYELLGQMGMPYEPVVTHLALITWATMHGATSLVLRGYFESFLGNQVESYVDAQIDALARSLGLA